MSRPPGGPTPRAESRQQQVARSIRNQIQAGQLRDGEVLPSTRELAAQWGVSVFTISEAMRVLAGEGLIESQSRSKRVVRSAGTVAPPLMASGHATRPADRRLSG